MSLARTTRLLPHALLVVGLVALVLGTWMGPALAADTTVEVGKGEASFTPAKVTVHPGDTVTWRWAEEETHSVNFSDRQPASTGGDGSGCISLVGNCKGHRFTATFEETGDYPYTDVNGSEGLVRVVEPQPEPTTSSPTPSPEPTTPSPSPTPEPTTSSPTPPPEEVAEPPSTGTGSQRTQAAAPPRVASESPTPTATPTPRASVTAPEPTFEGFPDAPDPSAEDVLGDVEVAPPGGGAGTSRVFWGALGGLTVLGTLGAFGRMVLFGDAWSPGG